MKYVDRSINVGICVYPGIPVTERNIDTVVTPPLEQMNSVVSVGKLLLAE